MYARIGQHLARLPVTRGDPLWLVALTAAAMTAAHLLAGTEGVLVAGLTAPLAVILFRRPLPGGRARGRHHGGMPPLCLAIRFPVESGPQGAARTDLIDRALDVIERRLTAECRRGDRLVRRGQTGFALMAADDSDIEHAVQFAFRVQRLCARPIRHGEDMLSLTPSIGFARARQVDHGGEQALLALAEEAAAAAALAGAGEVRAWTPALRDDLARHRQVADDLARAFDRGEIRPWFQPQVSTDTGDISGVEALVRWEHPDRGAVPPAEFLPAVAHCGLGGRLTQTVLLGALTAWQDWADAGIEVPRVSINLASDDLADPKLSAFVAWTLDRMGIPPDRLGIEVLETVVTTESDGPVASNLDALSRLGCFIDLDDFGTGHTSISTIRSLPIRRLKIDRSYVAAADRSRDQQRMLSAILTMAEQLGLDTLGEGVETPEEHAMLAQLGCGHVQGFAIARPMPAEALKDWAIRHRAALPRAAIAPAAPPAPRGAAAPRQQQPPPRGKTA